jgi:hypothetical protein
MDGPAGASRASPNQNYGNSGVRTNRSFAGVLFTGRHDWGKLWSAAWNTSHRQNASESGSRAMLLIHPAQPGGGDVMQEHQFTESFAFFSSPKRQREWQAIKNLKI